LFKLLWWNQLKQIYTPYLNEYLKYLFQNQK
jgi:hypothetical protein